MRWEKVKLEDICTKIGDGLHGTPKYDDLGEFYFINGNNFVNGKVIIKDDTKRISSIEYDKIKKELSDKTIFVAINGTLGNIGLYSNEPIALGKSACYINVNEKVERLFIRYVLESQDFQIYAHDFATGSTIKNLGLKAVRNYSFNLPSIPTQRRIASILSAYDDLIENNLKRIKLLEEQAFLRYKEIVRNEEMEEVAFSKVADYINGYPFKPEDWKNEGLPIIKIKELKGGISSDTPKNDGEEIPEKYIIDSKDILFAWSASIGVYLWYSGKAILNQHIFKVKPFDEDFHNWLYFSLLEKIPDFINLSNGATMQHIKKSALGMVFLPMPPKKVYQDFQQESEPIIQLIVNLQNQNAQLRHARDILLPKLMKGEIVV